MPTVFPTAWEHFWQRLEPQGTVVEIGAVRGIFAHKDNLKVGQWVSGTVQGYDEENMWILLDEGSDY